MNHTLCGKYLSKKKVNASRREEGKMELKRKRKENRIEPKKRRRESRNRRKRCEEKKSTRGEAEEKPKERVAKAEEKIKKKRKDVKRNTFGKNRRSKNRKEQEKKLVSPLSFFFLSRIRPDLALVGIPRNGGDPTLLLLLYQSVHLWLLSLLLQEQPFNRWISST